MLKTKNFGRKSLKEIKEILANMGLSPRHEDRQLAPDARALEGAAGAELSSRPRTEESTAMRHQNAGRKFDRDTSQPPRDVPEPGGEPRSRTSGSRPPTRRRRSSAAWPSVSSPRPSASARSPTRRRTKLSAGRQGQAPRDASASSRRTFPRFGNARREGRRDEEGRPRREGLRRSRQALRGSPRRLHAHHQARAAPRRQRAARR